MNLSDKRAHVFFLILPWLFSGILLFGQSREDYDRALAQFQAGQYASAATLFGEVEAASPGTTDALLYRAKCLVLLTDFAGAEQSLRSYLRSHKNSSDAMYMLGFVFNRENRPADSLAAYTKAAAIMPPAADDLKIVGLDYVLLDDYPDAIKWLEKSVSLDGNNKDTWYYLGRAYYTKGQLNQARDAFQRVVALDPFNAKAENNLGLIFETQGNATGAADAYRKAITWEEQNSEKNEQPYVNLGNLLAEQGHTQEAIGPLEKAVKLAPKNAYCHMTLGVLYHKIGDLEKARRELELATQLDPDNAKAHYQLGRLYKDMNEVDRAKAEFERTAELQSHTAKSNGEAQHP